MLHPRTGRSRIITLLLATLLVVCLFYQTYRYPLQINSSQTSPTYRDTPFWLQAGKWGLIALIAVALAVAVLPQLRNTLRTAQPVRLLAVALQITMLVLACVPVLRGATEIEPKITLILVAVSLLITLTPRLGDSTARTVTSVFIGFAVLCVVAQAVQLALFLAFGRLPALAWANSPSVRFGSLLDDPNGFAIVLAALIPITWIGLRHLPNLRIALLVALACCLPLTQSWTGLACVPFALAVTWVALHGIQRDVRRAGAVVVSALVVVGVAVYFARSTIAELIQLKRGSVEDHAASLDHITTGRGSGDAPSAVPAPSSIDAAPAPLPPEGASAPRGTHETVHVWTSGIESGHINLLVNYGPVLLLCYVALGAIAAYLLLRGKSALPLALRAGSAAYLVCYLVAATNLGLDRTFPCNVLYFAFCGFAFASTGSRGSCARNRAAAPLLSVPDRILTPSQ